jgi:hypothetical protein
MKFANARKLDRKSGVRLGEHGAPVQDHSAWSGDEIVWTSLWFAGPHMAEQEAKAILMLQLRPV